MSMPTNRTLKPLRRIGQLARPDGACRCEERLVAPSSRDWIILRWKVNDTYGKIRKTKASTVECFQCKALWRTSALFVDKIT